MSIDKRINFRGGGMDMGNTKSQARSASMGNTTSRSTSSGTGGSKGNLGGGGGGQGSEGSSGEHRAISEAAGAGVGHQVVGGERHKCSGYGCGVDEVRRYSARGSTQGCSRTNHQQD